MKNKADMSTPTLLGNATRLVLSAIQTTRTSLKGRTFGVRVAAIGFVVLSLTACGDALTGPQRAIDRDGVNAIMPAVQDARTRLTANIGNVQTRQQVILDLSQLEFALKSDDIAAATTNLKDLSTLLTTGTTRTNANAADISAILLALHAVADLVSAPELIPL